MDTLRTNMMAIVSLSAEDRKDAVEIWFDSFYDYPAMHRCFIGHAKSEQQYNKWLQVFFCLSFDYFFYLNYPLLGLTDETGQLVAIMACADLDKNKEWPEALHSSYEYFSNELGEEGVRKLELYEAITAENHPNKPYYFVDTIGVRKNCQGQGYARLLLREIQGISAADPKSSGVFLNTEVFENVAFYRHLGYELTGESDIEGLPSWHLFRPDEG